LTRDPHAVTGGTRPAEICDCRNEGVLWK